MGVSPSYTSFIGLDNNDVAKADFITWAAALEALLTNITRSASQTAFALGAVGAPGISFAGDLDTGMWSPAANTVAWSVGGAEGLRLTSAKRLGLNISTPANPFHIVSTDSADDNLIAMQHTATAVSGHCAIRYLDPAGLERAASGYGYHRAGPLKNVYFIEIGNINSSGDTDTTDFSLFVSTNGQAGLPSSFEMIRAAATGKLTVNAGANTNALVVNTNGRVGFGNSTPSYDVDLAKTASGGNVGFRVRNSAAGGGDTAQFTLETGAGASFLFNCYAGATSMGTYNNAPINFMTNNIIRTQIDTSGFHQLTGSLGLGAPVTKTDDFSLAATENYVINNKSGSTCTVTLPAASSWSGRLVFLSNEQAQLLVSASSNVVPKAGGAASTSILPATAGAWAFLWSNGTNWKILMSGT